MSWRKHENHAQETKAVKDALTRAGLRPASVTHGKGTAWAWLKVMLPRPRTLHQVPVNGEVRSMTQEQRNELPYYAPCIGNCAACELERERRAKASRIIADVTGRHGEYGGDVIVTTE